MINDDKKLRLLYVPSHFPPSAAVSVHRAMRICRYLPSNRFLIDVLTRDLGADPGGEEFLKNHVFVNSVHRVKLAGENDSQLEATPKSESTASGKPANRLIERLRQLAKPLRSLKELILETPDKHVGWNKPLLALGSKLCSQTKYDILLTSGPPHSVHLVGLQLKKKFGIPWVADFRDPWARRPWDVPHNPWGQKLLPKYERSVVETADAILLNTKATFSDFVQTYRDLSESKFHWVPNGMDPDLPSTVEPLLKSRAAATDERLRKITLCHAGSLYGNRRPDGLLEALALLKSRGLYFNLMQIGSVDRSICLTEKIQKLGLVDDVQCIPRVSHSEVLRLMAEVDLHVLLQPDGPLMIPGKVYEMIAYPQPIVAICDSPVTIEVVEQAGGTHAASRDVQGIARAILDAIEMREDPRFMQMRVSAREQFDGRKIVERLGEIIQSVCHNAIAGGSA